MSALRPRAPDAPPAALESVTTRGQLDGLLFTMTLRQPYRNNSPDNLELLYSFPLPPQALLLGFAAELGDRRLDGVVMPRAQAECVYVEALEGGDLPVMLEAAPGGLHTARIGNLQPSERAVLDIRFSQLLAFEQVRIRPAVPTTIAPRYGDAQAEGLAPHQVPAVSHAAAYALALEISVTGAGRWPRRSSTAPRMPTPWSANVPARGSRWPGGRAWTVTWCS